MNQVISINYDAVKHSLTSAMAMAKRDIFSVGGIKRYGLSMKRRKAIYKESVAAFDEVYSTSFLLDTYLIVERSQTNLRDIIKIANTHDLENIARVVSSALELTASEPRDLEKEVIGAEVYYTFLEQFGYTVPSVLFRDDGQADISIEPESVIL